MKEPPAAKEMNSFSDYKEGSATAEYRAMVDKAAAIAEQQKSRVNPMGYHEKIDHLLDTHPAPKHKTRPLRAVPLDVIVNKEGKHEPGPGQQHGGMAVYSKAAG